MGLILIKVLKILKIDTSSLSCAFLEYLFRLEQQDSIIPIGDYNVICYFFIFHYFYKNKR